MPDLAAPVLDDLDLGLAEVGIVVGNGAAAAEPDAGDAPDRRVAGDVEQRAVDPVHVLRHFLEHQHVAGEVGLERRADQLAEGHHVEGRDLPAPATDGSSVSAAPVAR